MCRANQCIQTTHFLCQPIAGRVSPHIKIFHCSSPTSFAGTCHGSENEFLSASWKKVNRKWPRQMARLFIFRMDRLEKGESRYNTDEKSPLPTTQYKNTVRMSYSSRKEFVDVVSPLFLLSRM
jgi:hypothetical protein